MVVGCPNGVFHGGANNDYATVIHWPMLMVCHHASAVAVLAGLTQFVGCCRPTGAKAGGAARHDGCPLLAGHSHRRAVGTAVTARAEGNKVEQPDIVPTSSPAEQRPKAICEAGFVPMLLTDRRDTPTKSVSRKVDL